MTHLRTISCWLIGIFFIIAGTAHWVVPRSYLPLMPPFLPWPLLLIDLSGLAEIAGGIGVCIPKWRRFAGWWLIALLVAVFPANLHMLMENVPLNGKHPPAWVLWARLPLQGVMMVWVYVSCVRKAVFQNFENLK